MDGREIEPRIVMWAAAEVSWEDSGATYRVPGTIEDTSRSGACVRVKRPVTPGSRVTIKWYREQFSAIARNCRSDGRDFLLGVRRDATPLATHLPQPALPPVAELAQAAPVESVSGKDPVYNAKSDPIQHEVAKPLTRPEGPRPQRSAFHHAKVAEPAHKSAAVGVAPATITAEEVSSKRRAPETPRSSPPNHLPGSGSSPRHERKVMPPKTFLPNFWRRSQDEDAPRKPSPIEAPMNKSTIPATQAASGAHGELLSYEDIYRAAGILGPNSGYSMHKVVDMLNSERIRDLPNDVKRASVLMALDAAGTSVEEVLQDSSRRQHALNTYEASQRKHLEDFEARKAQENSGIEEEMERVRSHYAQRVQNNLHEVTREKEALRNWQMAMQHESQRIAEVLELCGKQPAAAAAAAGAGLHAKSGEPQADPTRNAPRRPTLLSGH